MDVRIDEAHAMAPAGQLYGEVGRHRAFAHATLSGSDGDDVLDAWQHLTGIQRALLLGQGHHLHVSFDGCPESGGEFFQGKLDRFPHALAGVHGGVGRLDPQAQGPRPLFLLHLEQLDEVERDDVLAKVRLHHPGQGVEQVFAGQCLHGSKFG